MCLNNGSAEGTQKVARNKMLLEQELEADPHNMTLLMQRMDICNGDSEKVYAYVKEAISGIKEKWKNWETAGPHILRRATHAAKTLDRPEFDEWVALAEEMFPRSIFVRTDIQFYAAEHAWQKMDCPETIRRGEQYLQALKDYRERNFDLGDLNTGTIQTVLAHVETNLHPCLALAYLYEGQPDKAAETLTVLDYDTMDPGQTSVLTAAMLRLHALSDVDTEPLLREFWERISQPKPTKRMATDRREAFIAIGAPCFGAEYRKEETARILDPTAPLSLDTNAMTVEEWQILSTLPVYRHTYTLFLPLLGQCELGAAAIMDSNEPADMTKLLASIEHIQELPISALFHVLERGVAFPLKERPLNLEEMDSLAGRLIRLKSRQSSGRRIRISMR